MSDVAPPPYGEVSAEGGELAVAAVRAATEAALAGRIDALATAPLNKASMRLAGYEHAGHTELLADLCGGPEVSMVLVGPQLRVAHMTTHIALEDVPGRITAERLETVVGIADRAAAAARHRRAAASRWRASIPTRARAACSASRSSTCSSRRSSGCGPRGADVTGPLPGDTVFGAARAGRYDLVVAMYHDQGHIPIKLLHADEAVNVTGGLPIIRTSVDHGTAFDIAGQDKARSASMRAAVRARRAARLGAAQLPVERDQRGVVEPAGALGDQRVELLGDLAVAGSATPWSRAVSSAIPTSLRCSSIRKPGSKRIVQHLLAVRLEDLRLREPAEQRLAHARGIDTGLRRQRQRLGDRLDRERDDDLVRGLRDLTRTRRADVGRRLAELVEDRLGPRHRLLAPAGHDRELPVDGGRLSTRHGRVDRLDAALGEDLVHLP